MSADSFYEMIVEMSSDEDKIVYENIDFKNKYQLSLNSGLGQSMDSYLQDLKLCINQWPFNIEDITNSVHLFYGLKDTSTVHSPDFGEELCLRNPLFKRKVYPEFGSALIWTRAQDILRVIKD